LEKRKYRYLRLSYLIFLVGAVTAVLVELGHVVIG
jgi:hypothetical protein